MTAQRQRVWIELYLVILKYGEYNDVQTSDNSQNFNHYSYRLNNPLKYVDPTGEAYYHTDRPKEIERFLKALQEGTEMMLHITVAMAISFYGYTRFKL